MINLLPPEEKQKILKEKRLKTILILEIFVLSFLVSLALILFLVKTYLKEEIAIQKIFFLEREQQIKIHKIQENEKEIEVLNNELLKLDSFYQNQIYLSEILEKISQILPPDIYLANFNFQKESSQISINGFCPSQEILLELKKNLGKQDFIKDLYFPLSNWIKPNDIDFNLSFKLKSILEMNNSKAK